jgi:hypothetical protein
LPLSSSNEAIEFADHLRQKIATQYAKGWMGG